MALIIGILNVIGGRGRKGGSGGLFLATESGQYIVTESNNKILIA